MMEPADAGWDPDSIPAIARYAARKGPRLMLWTAWDALQDPAQRERLFARWASWGVAGVKVDFLLSDSAARMAIYDDIARDAARHRLTVVFHGSTIPRGIQRTWPNVLTMEAVRGADLISSTFRQLLISRALGLKAPDYFHCPLVIDEQGRRLAKRDATTTLRGLRSAGATPESCRGA
jgi:hypothetical protein